MVSKLGIRWSRNAGKVMRSKLRKKGIRVSEEGGRVGASLELVVEFDGKVVRVSVPPNYLLVAPADSDAIVHLLEHQR